VTRDPKIVGTCQECLQLERDPCELDHYREENSSNRMQQTSAMCANVRLGKGCGGGGGGAQMKEPRLKALGPFLRGRSPFVGSCVCPLVAAHTHTQRDESTHPFIGCAARYEVRVLTADSCSHTYTLPSPRIAHPDTTFLWQDLLSTSYGTEKLVS
jgi:hypothetical protein